MEYTKEGAKPESNDSMVEWDIGSDAGFPNGILYIEHHGCVKHPEARTYVDIEYCWFCQKKFSERVLKIRNIIQRMYGEWS